MFGNIFCLSRHAVKKELKTEHEKSRLDSAEVISYYFYRKKMITSSQFQMSLLNKVF